MSWKKLIPEPIKAALRPIVSAGASADVKHDMEMGYWKSRFEQEGGELKNHHYERIMLAMAGEENATFLVDKVVADFGCGPRGSLVWATPARVRIGIDVLVDRYMDLGIGRHPICYIASTEQSIPLPSGYVDVLYTLNAIDHVTNFEAICRELLRVLAPGGAFIASFNLDEPPTECEPQTLTAERVQRELLDRLEVQSYRVAAQSQSGDTYEHFFDGSPAPQSGRRFLWVRAKKPAR